NGLSALTPPGPGPGQVRPAVTPAVTTVIATVDAIMMFIQAATALRRSQARVPLSLGTEPELRAGLAAGSWARPGVCGPAAGPIAGPVRSGASVVIPYPHTALVSSSRRGKRTG